MRNPKRKKYSIGFTLLELRRKAYGKTKLRDVAKIPMEKLMEKIGETFFLGIFSRDHVTILDMVESHQKMTITSPPGTRLPIIAGATVKVFLSQLEEKKAKEVIQKIGLVKFTYGEGYLRDSEDCTRN